MNVRRLLNDVQSRHFYNAWYKFTHFIYPAISAGLNFTKDTFVFFPMTARETIEEYVVRLNIRRNEYLRQNREDISDEKMRTTLMFATVARAKLHSE